jgi:AcrR family transcriptional regulator
VVERQWDRPDRGKNNYAFPAGFAPDAQVHNELAEAISVFALSAKIAYKHRSTLLCAMLSSALRLPVETNAAAAAPTQPATAHAGSPLASLPPAARILRTAARLFYEQGYHATGINQIIAEAGVAKATFYSHYPSKDTLGAAWLAQQHEAWVSWLTERVTPVPDARRRVAVLFDLLEVWLRNNDYRGCPFLNTNAEQPNPPAELRAIILQHKSYLRDYLRNLVRAALPGRLEADRMALAAYVLFCGAIIEAQAFRDPWPVRTAAQTILGWF